MTSFPFIGGSFAGRSPVFDGQRTINLYPEASESGTSQSPAMLVGTPGLALWASNGIGGCRASIVFNDTTAFVLVGNGLWRYDATGVGTQIASSIDSTRNIASMASNGTIVMLVTGAKGYFIHPTTNFVTEILDTDFTGANAVGFCDGYFVFDKPGTGEFQITQLYGEDIDGLDFATAEGSPDNLVTLIVDHREIWLLGASTTEVWIDNGDADFPFARIQSAFLEVGCAAAASVAKMDNSIFWLGQDERGIGSIFRASGYTPTRISNHGIEYKISQMSRIDDAIAYTYSQEGHNFYVLTFPTANQTLVYDASTQLWHERAWRNPLTASLNRHRSNCHMFFAGKNLVGDWQTGNIYQMDLNTYSDNGDLIASIRECPHITSDGKLQFHHALEVFLQAGVGLSSGQGSDPQAMLQWSEDGGQSWSSEHWTSFGKIGQRLARARYRRLGRTRDRVYRFAITDPVKRIITGASLSVTAGSS